MKTVLALCALLVSLSSAAVHAGDASSSRATETLLRAEDRLARTLEAAGPIQGFVPHLTLDVAYLHPGEEIITGRSATKSFLKSQYADAGDVAIKLHRVAGQASSDGKLGYTFGWFEEVAASLSYGRYIAAWKKEADGWRVQAFLRIASTRALAPPPADALIIDGAPLFPQFGLPAAHALDVAIADARFADLSVDEGYTVAFSEYAMDESVFVSSTFYWNRAGVELAWSGWTPAEQLSWHPLRAEASGSGDLAWSIGHGVFLFADGETEQRSYSKYLTIWIRTEEGWRFLLDGGNARPAP